VKREKCRGCKTGREKEWTAICKETKRRSVKGKRERERGEGKNVQRRISLHELHVYGLNMDLSHFYLDDKKVGCYWEWSRPKWFRIRLCGGIL